MRQSIRVSLFLLLGALASSVSGIARAQAPEPERKAFRVCQDPNNLPFSNLAAEGYENRIAELFARELRLKLEYYSFPARMAFIRNTLRYKLPGEDYRCDVVMGVPVGFDQVSATGPYFRSTYALVFPRQGPLAAVKSGEDFAALPAETLRQLRIGIVDRSPASAWLMRRGLVEQGVPYRMLSPDPEQYPGEIIEKDLVAGKIDVAVMWGPIAGFFARRVQTPELAVVALRSEPGVKFDYEMAMGVRYGEKAWKAQIEELIQSKQEEIRAILADFNVPMLDGQGQLIGAPPGAAPLAPPVATPTEGGVR